MAGVSKNPDSKKKFLNPRQLQKLNQVVVIGDFFECDNRVLKREFTLIPFPQEISTIRNLLQKQNKPVFFYLEKRPSYVSGKATPALAGRSYEYFIRAMNVVTELGNASLVTLPVSKELILKSGHPFYGHTEFLEKHFQQTAVMCMYHPDLSIVPLTQHIPLKKVPSEIKKVDSEAIARSIIFLRKLTNFKKRIALTGLNPHAGENGKVGDEEFFLKEWLEKIKQWGIAIEGPLPADGLFMPSNRIQYSLILATYHDQALIPFKALFGTKGLNITLNLPVLRVSPDHGPAYEYAGKSSADIQSVLQSLVFAMETGEKWIKLYSSH